MIIIIIIIIITIIIVMWRFIDYKSPRPFDWYQNC